MRYRIRDSEGHELRVPSLAHLAALHRQGLLDDEELVRQETSDRWVRAGDLLAGGRRRGGDRRWLWSAILGALALVAALALILAARQAGGR